MKKFALSFALASVSSAALASPFDVPAVMSCRAQGSGSASAFTYVLTATGTLNTGDESVAFNDDIKLTVLRRKADRSGNVIVLDRASLQYDNGGMGHALYNVPASVNGLQVLVGAYVRGGATVRHTLPSGGESIDTVLKCVTETYDQD